MIGMDAFSWNTKRPVKSYSVTEAAAELGISPGLVYRLLVARKLGHERHGLGRGKYLIPQVAIDAYRRSVTVVVGDIPAIPPVRQTLKHLSLS